MLAARTDDAVPAMFGDRLELRSPRISDHRSGVAGHAAADLADLAVGPQILAAG